MDDQEYIDRYNDIYQKSEISTPLLINILGQLGVYDQYDCSLLIRYFNYLRNTLSMSFAYGKSAKNVYKMLEEDQFTSISDYALAYFVDRQSGTYCSKYKIQLVFIILTEITMDLMPYKGKWKAKILDTIINKLIDAKIYN